jgi:cholesterol oxidase
MRDAHGTHDVTYDWVVVGSGFGGSVAALRLAERGYSVLVLECGRRYTPDSLPRSAWDLRRFIWAPGLGLHGTLRISSFRDASILSGAGVGGGSLVYAQTLYRATDAFRTALDTAVGEPVDLDPYYDVAERMLGVVQQDHVSSRDTMMIAAAADLGIGAERFHTTSVGVFRGAAGVRVPDPYFGGEGPDRVGCIDCGQCFLGCRHESKNTLDKNYLWLAERRGVRIEPERQVVGLRPVGGGDGADGYEVVTQRPGAWLRKDRLVVRARGVVLAAGAVGTNQLLADCKETGSLAAVSDHLGKDVRTNSESVCAITSRDKDADLTDGVAITGSLFPSPELHLEGVTYGGLGDSMGMAMVPLSGDGTRLTRPLKLLVQILLHPLDFLRSANPVGWSRRSFLIGGMWTRDGSIRFERKRRLLRRGVRLNTRQDPDHPNPTFIPEMYDFVKHLAEKNDAIAQIWVTEAFNKPVTAHIMGGAVVGPDPDHGVVDGHHRVFGYRNLLVTDGAAVPFNPGVNPALTITALAERALAQVAAKDGSVHVGGIGYPSGTTQEHAS